MMSDQIHTFTLYNCLDAMPSDPKFDCFYTNPPWGAYNNGESVTVFTQRGMEAIGYEGDGLVVIADDAELEWPKQVLGRTQAFASQQGFYVSRMMPQLHLYHLDDAPELHSCNLIISSLPGNGRAIRSEAITDPARLNNFYGRSKAPRARYIRERKTLNYGMAQDHEYSLELIEGLE
jgi:hypothetical protein